jgi:cytochrome c oxidase subunit 2
LGRVLLIAGLLAAGAGAGIAWGWAPPMPVQRTFHVTARQFGYDPGILRANRGDHVVIEVKSADVTHGLFIDGYGLRGTVAPGRDLRLSFVANRAGRFAFRCSEVCGVFHPFMTGTLVVEPNLLLPGSIGLAAAVAVSAVLWSGWSARREEP